MTDDNVLETTRATVARWPGWDLRRTLSEPNGWRYGFACDARGKRVVCVVKRELWQGLASFMRRAVEHDVPRLNADALVEFVGEEPAYSRAWAFDPWTVREHGELSDGPSAKGKMTTWYELPASEWGVPLGRYVVEGAPLVPPGGVVAGQVTLDGVGP